MNKRNKPCIHCGDRRVQWRIKTRRMVSEKALQHIWETGVGFCVLTCILACIVIVNRGYFKFFALAGIITAGAFLLWRILRYPPFMRKRIYHFKCLSCGCTWDV